jgi:peptide/nickel transport system permease protein
MLNYIIRRLLLVPVLLFGVTVIIFGMLQFLGPVERSALYIRDFPKNDKQIQAVITKFGLDRPFYEQYWRWLAGHKDAVTGERKGGIIYGDFGYSRTGSQPVIDIIKNRFPNTLDLTLWAVVPVLSVGIWLGVQAAVLQHSRHLIPNICIRFISINALLRQTSMVPARKNVRLGQSTYQHRGFHAVYKIIVD